MIRRMLILMLVLAAIATVTLGIASCFKTVVLLRPPKVGFWEDLRRDARHEFTIKVTDGGLIVWYRDRIRLLRPSPGWGPLTKYEFAGFRYSDRTGWLRVFTTRSIDVELPLWMPFVLFAAYPTVALIRGPLRHWRWQRKGSCLSCGYNLTGNTSGVCPECGTGLESRQVKDG